jgi:hypothetical protein
MRDISGGLKDRANLLERQIAGAQGQFDKLIEQLSRGLWPTAPYEPRAVVKRERQCVIFAAT